MPRQIITLEVFYDPIDNDGNEKPAPQYWPWESMADTYSEDDGSPFYTRMVKVFGCGPVEPLASDGNAALEWHQEHCDSENCARGDSDCPEAVEEDDED